MSTTTICTIIIGRQAIHATNDGKSSPEFRMLYEDRSVAHHGHAETRAIQKAGKRSNLSGAKVYVHRVLASGKVSMARPCKHCQEFMRRKGVKMRNVWYTNWEGAYERMRERG